MVMVATVANNQNFRNWYKPRQEKPANNKNKPKSYAVRMPVKSNLKSFQEVHSIPVGGLMSIWNIKLDTGYEEVIFAESYNDAYIKAEHNEKHPEDKSNGFEIFYTLAKDIREIRDDLVKIKNVIKLPSDEKEEPYV